MYQTQRVWHRMEATIQGSFANSMLNTFFFPQENVTVLYHHFFVIYLSQSIFAAHSTCASHPVIVTEHVTGALPLSSLIFSGNKAWEQIIGYAANNCLCPWCWIYGVQKIFMTGQACFFFFFCPRLVVQPQPHHWSFSSCSLEMLR